MRNVIENADNPAPVDDEFDPIAWVQSRLTWESRLGELRAVARSDSPPVVTSEITEPSVSARPLGLVHVAPAKS
jgi:hypothetical protein